MVSNFAASFGSVLGATSPWITIKNNKPTPSVQPPPSSLPLSWEDVGSASKTFTQDLKRSSSLKLQQPIVQKAPIVSTPVPPPDTEPQAQDTEVLDDVNKLLHEDDIMFQFDDVKSNASTLSTAMNEIDEGGLSFMTTHPFEHNVQHSLKGSNYEDPYKTPPKNRPQQPILICKFFADFGICKAGDACRFSHDENLLQTTSVTFSEPYPPKTPSPPMLTPPHQQGMYNNSSTLLIQPIPDYSPTTITPSSPITIGSTTSSKSSGGKYCRFYQQGFCRNAESCPFLHVPANGAPISSSNNNSTSPPSSFNSPPVAQVLTYQFPSHSLPSPMQNSNETIMVSPRILNRAQRSSSMNNTTPTMVSTPTTMSTSNDSNKVCPFFLKGECKFGDRCRYSHPKQALLRKNSLHKERQLLSEESLRKFSQIPCKYYTTQGSCPFGDQCFYKHDPFADGEFSDMNYDDDEFQP